MIFTMTLALNPAVSPTPFPAQMHTRSFFGGAAGGAQGSLYAEASGNGEGGEGPGTSQAQDWRIVKN